MKYHIPIKWRVKENCFFTDDKISSTILLCYEKNSDAIISSTCALTLIDMLSLSMYRAHTVSYLFLNGPLPINEKGTLTRSKVLSYLLSLAPPDPNCSRSVLTPPLSIQFLLLFTLSFLSHLYPIVQHEFFPTFGFLIR